MRPTFVLLLGILLAVPFVVLSAPAATASPDAFPEPVAADVYEPAPEAFASVPAWVDVATPVAPAVRASAGFVWYASAGRFVLFGGEQSAYSTSGLNDTWSFDPVANAWTRLNPDESPARRVAISMVYDPRADRAILFGGMLSSPYQPLNDTWAFDYTNHTWVQRSPPTAPPPVFSPAMAYDAGADRVILWGGQPLTGGPVFTNDTWAYDYASDTWTNLTLSVTHAPPASTAAQMAYDPTVHRMVLDLPGYPYTFLFDYANLSWTSSYTPTSPGHGLTPLVFHDGLSASVIFGGVGGGLTWPTDTWAYQAKANAWSQVATLGSPSRRANPAAAYDSTHDRLVLFGGFQDLVSGMATGYVNDTWLLVRATPPAAPQGLQALAGAGQVRLSWQAPASDGGLAISGYRIYRGTTSGGAVLLASLGTGTSYSDTNVTDGTTYYYNVTAVNAAGEGASSAVASATPQALQVTASPLAPVGVAPFSVSFTASATGGRSPYAYAWSFSDGGTSAVANPSHTFLAAGNYTARVNVTDAFGSRATSTVNVRAVNPLTLALAAANLSSGTAPLSVQFQASPAGGLAPYNYTWSFDDGATSDAQNPLHTFAAAGTYHVNLTVKDQLGGFANKSFTIVVSAATSPPPSNPTGAEGVPLWAWAVPIVVAVAALAGWALWRRRRKGGPESP